MARDKPVEYMGLRHRQADQIARGVMNFMKPPPIIKAMLQAMKNVILKIKNEKNQNRLKDDVYRRLIGQRSAASPMLQSQKESHPHHRGQSIVLQRTRERLPSPKPQLFQFEILIGSHHQKQTSPYLKYQREEKCWQKECEKSQSAQENADRFDRLRPTVSRCRQKKRSYIKSERDLFQNIIPRKERPETALR